MRAIGAILVVLSLAAVWLLSCTEGALKVDVSPNIPAETVKLVVEHPTSAPYVQVSTTLPAIVIPEHLISVPQGAVSTDWHLFNGKTVPILMGVIALLLLFIKSPHEWFQSRPR